MPHSFDRSTVHQKAIETSQSRLPTYRAAEKVQTIVNGSGALQLSDSKKYVDSLGGAADSFRSFVYALLSIALLISLVGIANTTVLSMNERSREIGIMRAIGTTARQVRKVVRLEALFRFPSADTT